MRTNDPLKQFVFLRNNLQSEKARLEARLKEINEALGVGGEYPLPVPTSSQERSGKRTMSDATKRKLALAQRRRWAEKRRGKSGSEGSPAPARKRPTANISLRKAALQLAKLGPLTKREIIDGAKKLGWKTTAKNMNNILNPLLYGKSASFKIVGRGKYAPK